MPRTKGAIGKKSKELIARAAELGISPMEVMLDNMRVAYESAKAAEQEIPILNPELLSRDAMAAFKLILKAVQKAVGFRQLAQSCAADVAPYIHPRLAAVQHSGEVTTVYVMRTPHVAENTKEWQQQHVPPTMQ
jgi:hypothetical protein